MVCEHGCNGICCAGHRRRSHEGAVFVLHDEEIILCEQNMSELNCVSKVRQKARMHWITQLEHL